MRARAADRVLAQRLGRGRGAGCRTAADHLAASRRRFRPARGQSAFVDSMRIAGIAVGAAATFFISARGLALHPHAAGRSRRSRCRPPPPAVNAGPGQSAARGSRRHRRKWRPAWEVPIVEDNTPPKPPDRLARRRPRIRRPRRTAALAFSISDTRPYTEVPSARRRWATRRCWACKVPAGKVTLTLDQRRRRDSRDLYHHRPQGRPRRSRS